MKSVSNTPFGDEHLIWVYIIDNVIYNTPECNEPNRDKYDVGVWRIKK